MSTYITLLNWTEQGIQSVKDSPARLEKAKAATKAAGGEIKGVLYDHGAVRHGRRDRSAR